MAKPATSKPGLEARLNKINGLNHIYYFDVKGDGRLREVAVVKMAKTPDDKVSSVYYIDVQLLDDIDKGRLKAIITNRHADKYELWDLLSQSTLNNGKNALDYFHQLTKVEHGEGAVTGGPGGSLLTARSESSKMIGADFSDPTSGALETQPVN